MYLELQIYYFSIFLKLDTLSREDLVKYIKKQMVALQKTKSKCEG